MFVQVIKGQVSSPDDVNAAMERWMTELAPGATGWLGSTAGVADDGRLVAIARFESEEAARRNSERPEQDQWWSQTAKLFTGEVTFQDSADVVLDVVGEPDKAGFVQVMQGRNSNPDRARELMSDDNVDWAGYRPDILASVGIGHDGGGYTMVLYFTSEEAARDGERKEPPPELKAVMEEMDELAVGETDFIDLRQPRFYAPR
jgi:hypothetical protein